GAVEAPGGQSIAGVFAPCRNCRREFLPVVTGVSGAELRVLPVAAIEDVDPEAVEPVAARRFEPGNAVFAYQRPAARRRAIELAGADWRRQQQRRGCRAE